MKKNPFFWILAISLLTHLLFFGQPKEMVFDEHYFGNFAQDYLKGRYFFDIHPPLGKMLIAGTGKLMGYGADYDFGGKNRRYPTNDYLILRLLPLVAGIFLGPLLYLVSRELRFSEKASVLVGLFTSVDSALITESHFILLTTILLFFGFAAILFFLKYKNSLRGEFLLAAGFLAGCAASVKWTGLSFPGIIIIFYLFLIFKVGRKKIRPLRGFLYLIVIPALFYFFVFTLHFQLLRNSGRDNYIHTPEFQKTLAGSVYECSEKVIPLNNFEKFVEENRLMYKTNADLSVAHDYASKWYAWPFLGKPVYYWASAESPGRAAVYLVGNPIIWLSGFLAVLVVAGLFLLAIIKRIAGLRKLSAKDDLKSAKLDFAASFLLVGFFINFIPFIFIHRIMFVYSYFPALIFSILALGYAIDRVYYNRRLMQLLYLEAALFYLILIPFTCGVSLF